MKFCTGGFTLKGVMKILVLVHTGQK